MPRQPRGGTPDTYCFKQCVLEHQIRLCKLRHPHVYTRAPCSPLVHAMAKCACDKRFGRYQRLSTMDWPAIHTRSQQWMDGGGGRWPATAATVTRGVAATRITVTNELAMTTARPTMIPTTAHTARSEQAPTHTARQRKPRGPFSLTFKSQHGHAYFTKLNLNTCET